MRTNIRNVNGDMSAYGLACGYVDSFRQEALYIELYKQDNVYHVRQFNNNVRYIWDSYHTLKEARSRFNKMSLNNKQKL